MSRPVALSAILASCCPEANVEVCDESGLHLSVDLESPGTYTVEIEGAPYEKSVTCTWPEVADCVWDGSGPGEYSVDAAGVFVHLRHEVLHRGWSAVVGPEHVEIRVFAGDGARLVEETHDYEWLDEDDRCGSCGPRIDEEVVVP